MIDFLLNEYYPYYKGEKEYLAENIRNREIVEEHVRSLARQYKRFSLVYKINRYIIKFIPIIALAAFLVMPTFYLIIFIAAFLLIFLCELVINLFFPRKYYEKISSNILILKSIIRLDKEKESVSRFS